MTDWGSKAAHYLDTLANYSEPGPGVTRLPYTTEHRDAIAQLTSWMKEAGLAVSLDAAGTLVGRYQGDAGTGTVYLGSHQDSVRQGGAFDGIMGVVLPLLAMEKLSQAGASLAFNVEVLAFADEEGVRFPTALVGSRALANHFDSAVLALKDTQGVSLAEAITNFGLDPSMIGELYRSRQDAIAYIETHIEQGPVLQQRDEAVGVVTAICGIERHSVRILGETGHAGTLPMNSRRDALVSAASLVTEVNRLALETEGVLATVGELHVRPNSVNAVPSEVNLVIEIRSAEDHKRRRVGELLAGFARTLCGENGLSLTMERSYAQAAQPCDKGLQIKLSNAATQVTGSSFSLASGATHDASAMADLCPIAMLFVRCKDGLSHHPEEFTSPADMAVAIDVLETFLMDLNNELLLEKTG